MPPEAFDCGGSYPPLFCVSDAKTKVPGSNPSSRKTKPPLRAVNEESQQSRACGALYFVVSQIFAHELLANGITISVNPVTAANPWNEESVPRFDTHDPPVPPLSPLRHSHSSA
jgi:hypothetical protein